MNQHKLNDLVHELRQAREQMYELITSPGSREIRSVRRQLYHLDSGLGHVIAALRATDPAWEEASKSVANTEWLVAHKEGGTDETI